MKITYCHPVVYRFLKEVHIDSFLGEGELQLSTLANCKQNIKGGRQDEEEGSYLFYFSNHEGMIGVDCSIGANAYLLSTSLSFAALHKKEHEYCLEFRDVEALANAVAGALEAEHGVKVNEVVAGPCNYSERMRIIELSEGMLFADIGLRKGAALGEDELVDKDLFYAQLRSQYGDRVCFTKPARLLAEQEYRIMWLVDKVVAEPIKVHLSSPKNLASKIRSINLITKEDAERFLRMLQQRYGPQIADLRRQMLGKNNI